MKKLLVVSVLLLTGVVQAKTYTYSVMGPLNEAKRANIEKALKAKHMANVSKVSIDPMKSTVSVDGIDNLNEADLKSAISSEGLTVK
ncbi:MAG: hypothetical protein R2877_06155 [Bdellovibrionota bacterium]